MHMLERMPPLDQQLHTDQIRRPNSLVSVGTILLSPKYLLLLEQNTELSGSPRAVERASCSKNKIKNSE